MEGQDTINITVLIASRPYPLKIKGRDEAAIRKIVQEINDKVNRFQLTYSNKDKQDFLAMAALTYAVDLYKTRQSTTSDATNELSDQLDHLTQLLDNLLKN